MQALKALTAQRESTPIPLGAAGAIAIVAHDLRNPLNSIVMGARVFANDAAVPADVRRGLEKMERAAWRMNELIDTLLDFSAAHFTGAIPVSPVATDLDDVTERVLDELRSAHLDRVINYEHTGSTRGIWDPARLAQVVSNLVGNALTHGTSTTAVEVRVDGRIDEVALTVRNEGPAIPGEISSALFEPFRRGANPNKHGHSLGLGLYIARQIVVAHGGTIDVDCSRERGTLFTVRLPRFSIATGARAAGSASASAESAPRHRPHPHVVRARQRRARLRVV
jgi:sigma-B regulation protein RsbU (phosphoserine phosphatase)